MSKSYREQHPLLCDEYSDDEVHTPSPKFQRRIRYSNSSDRARAQIKGAAAILNRWPEHLSTILTYWWIGLGMIAVLVFIIYNSIAAIALLPPTHLMPAISLNHENSLINKSPENSTLPNIFMHIFVTSTDVININDHFSYIEPFSKKYSVFQKNIIFVINDSTDDIIGMSDEMKNEMALNSLWPKPDDVLKSKFQKNITFRVISLTKYMDESPLRKFWRRLPHQFLEFLTRCIAVWEKGGIAFNPAILSSDHVNPIYMDKINTFLNQYVQFKEIITLNRKKSTRRKSKKRLNNIQDIIENLENEEHSNQNEYNLSEAENIKIISTVKYNTDNTKDTKPEMLKKYKNIKNISKKPSNSDFLKNNGKTESTHFTRQPNNTSDNSKPKFLPMLLKLIYPDHLSTIEHNDSRSDVQQNILTKHSNESDRKVKKNRNHNRSSKLIKMKETNLSDHTFPKLVDNSRLAVDLKGDLVATNTSCHAFIGSVFSNAVHHSEKESITDFIIKELSIFCKGILSLCNGVDVVLL